MPSTYINNFDMLGGIILSPRALPPTPSLTANYVAERAEALRNAESAAEATFRATMESIARQQEAAHAARASSIAAARASTSSVAGTRSTALRTAHETALRPLLKSWLFDNPTHTLADQIAAERAAFLLDMQEQAGAPFRHHILLVIADLLADGNAGPDGPRTMAPAAGMRQFMTINLYTAGTGLVTDLDKSLRAGGARTFLAMQAIESWAFDRIPQAAGMSGVSTATFTALLACGTVAEAAAVASSV